MQQPQWQTTAHTRDIDSVQIVYRLQERKCKYLERDEQVKAIEGKNELMAKVI